MISKYMHSTPWIIDEQYSWYPPILHRLSDIGGENDLCWWRLGGVILWFIIIYKNVNSTQQYELVSPVCEELFFHVGQVRGMDGNGYEDVTRLSSTRTCK